MRKIKIIRNIFERNSDVFREKCGVDLRGEEVTCIHCDQVTAYVSDLPFNHLWDAENKKERLIYSMEESRDSARHLTNPKTTEQCLREFGVPGPGLRSLAAVCRNPSCPPEILRAWWNICKNPRNEMAAEVRDAIMGNPTINMLYLESPGEAWVMDVLSMRDKMDHERFNSQASVKLPLASFHG